MALVLINGAAGEGGGQVLRSSLALSLLTRKPVRIDNIRARRAKPGLMRQHLTAVQAAAKIGNANVTGATLGSSRLTFEPGLLMAGDYHFAIGTAGSTMLVLQTILLPLLFADGPSTVVLEGGTHNPMAPPFEFIERAYVPLLRQLGAVISVRLERPGFYPAGGGRCVVEISPIKTLGSLELLERGELIARRVSALVARLSRTVAQRECDVVLNELDWPEECQQIVEFADSSSPGNLVAIELGFEHMTEVFVAFGEKGKPAELVAEEAVSRVRTFLKGRVPVGEYMADQILLPLGIGAFLGTGGGSFRTGPLSQHATTHVTVLKQFLDLSIHVTELDDDTCEVRLS